MNGARESGSSPDAHACLGAKGRRSASASSTPAGDSRGVAKGVGRRSLGGPAAGSMRAGSVRRAPVMRRAGGWSAGAGAFARAPASLCVRGPGEERMRKCFRSAVGAGASYAPGGALARRSRATVPAAAAADLSDVAAEPPPSAPKSEPSVSLSHLVCSSIDALRKSSTCLRSLDTVEVPLSSSRAQPMTAPASNVKCDGEEPHVCVRARARVVSAASQRRARRGVVASHARRRRPARSFHASSGGPRAGRVAFVDVRDQSAKVDRHRRGRVVVVGARDSSLVPALLAATQHHVSERSHNEKQRRRVGATARGRQARRARETPRASLRRRQPARRRRAHARRQRAQTPPARAQPPQPPPPSLARAPLARARWRSDARRARGGKARDAAGERRDAARPLACPLAARSMPRAGTHAHTLLPCRARAWRGSRGRRLCGVP